VGWVGRDPVLAIEAALLSKKDKYTTYRAVAEDIRLLIVADRTQNSGKLVLEADTRLDITPFRAAYFLSYPDSLVAL
jgi:2-methylaconitate cis-trans-isomerase PrpF